VRASGSVALEALRDQGVIRAFDAGINEREMIPRLLALVDLDFFPIAMPYTSTIVTRRANTLATMVAPAE